MRLLALVLFSLLTIAAKAESVCDFYLDTAQELGCGEDNYLVHFGHRYCRKFEVRDAKFSSHVRPVLSRLRLCLIDVMSNAHPTCETTEKIGYASHIDCYVESGFCELKTKEKAEILWQVRGEFFNPKFRQAANAILRGCREK